ncbi:MAG: aspartate aminotransferase family protein [Armatimonadetes bacterium]|nr:aspartate aminotransferase family protein [Armatimonadota bacterium]
MTSRNPADLLAEDRRHLIHPLHHPSDTQDPVVFVEGKGAILKSIDGKEYIDSLSCLWNVNAGHGRAELAEAAAEQMSRMAYATNYAGATNPPAIELAARLVKISYPSMSGVYFTTSGAEANEAAFKTARYFWKVQGKPNKVKFISRIHAYHGVSMATMTATGMPIFSKMFAPGMPNIVHVPAPYPYRPPAGDAHNGDAGLQAAEALEQAILREGPDTVAAFIAEPVMGAGGVIPPPPSYFPRVREICDRHEVLFIADEVITGFGRTGRWFALGHWGVQPDMVAFAKGVTSAYLPLGGIIVNSRIHGTIVEAPLDMRYMHAATYSGHATCCAVGVRNLEIIEKEGLVERAGVLGKRLLTGLETLRDLPCVGDVRGMGLMCGVELVEDRKTKAPAVGLGGKVLREARKRQLFGRIRAGVKTGESPIGDTICIAPPLVTTEEQIERIVSIYRESITAAMAA